MTVPSTIRRATRRAPARRFFCSGGTGDVARRCPRPQPRSSPEMIGDHRRLPFLAQALRPATRSGIHPAGPSNRWADPLSKPATAWARRFFAVVPRYLAAFQQRDGRRNPCGWDLKNGHCADHSGAASLVGRPSLRRQSNSRSFSSRPAQRLLVALAAFSARRLPCCGAKPIRLRFRTCMRTRGALASRQPSRRTAMPQLNHDEHACRGELMTRGAARGPKNPVLRKRAVPFGAGGRRDRRAWPRSSPNGSLAFDKTHRVARLVPRCARQLKQALGIWQSASRSRSLVRAPIADSWHRHADLSVDDAGPTTTKNAIESIDRLTGPEWYGSSRTCTPG